MQLNTLAIIPHLTGTISTIASSYVLQDIVRDPKKRQRTYCRLVFGMAAIDFLTSLMYAFSTLPMEQGAQYGVFALGNQATCTTQAFLIQMEIASPIYHFYLAWYYLLILKYRWPERKFQGYENYMHGFALFFSLGTSIGLLPFDVYGEFFVWCWITNVEGNGYYQWFFFFGPLWFIILASSVIMAQMYSHVRAEESVSRKWRSSVVDTSKLGEKKLKKMTGRVFWQAMHYELAFYATWTIPTISQTILQLYGIEPAFGMQLANAIFTPLAGFFNFTIYIRPRYVKYMEENKKEMWWYVLWKAVKHSVPSRKMKVEIVAVNFDSTGGEKDATNRNEDDAMDYDDNNDDESSAIKLQPSNQSNFDAISDCASGTSIEEKKRRKRELEAAFSRKADSTISASNKPNTLGSSSTSSKQEENKAQEPDYGYEDPDASINMDDFDTSHKFAGESMKRRNSHGLVVLDYEEDDVGIMDPAMALAHSERVDKKLKMMSLPKKGGKKVYKLVRKVNKGVKKRRRSLMGSVRSLIGVNETPSASIREDAT